jgi:hypothetical protein
MVGVSGVAMFAAVMFAGLLFVGGQDAGEQDRVTVLPDVEVTRAPVTIEAARTYVEEVATRPFGALTLGRWETPLCPEVQNLTGEKPSLIEDRIRLRARQVGATVADGDCRANVVIVMTADGARTAANFVEAAPRAFKPSNGPTQRDGDALDEFMRSDAPVRWWHISGLYSTHRRTFITPASSAAPLVLNTTGSVYFNQDLRQAFHSVFIVVDVTRTGRLGLSGLSDYLAMVVLAEVDPHIALPRYPSILNVWSEPTTVDSAMTSWDLGYLKGLYSADVRVTGSGTPVESGFQQSEIARGIVASLEDDASTR